MVKLTILPKRRGKTDGDLIIKMTDRVYVMNAPFSNGKVLEPYWPAEQGTLQQIADELTKSGRKGFLASSAYRVEVASHGLVVYKKGYKKDITFAIIQWAENEKGVL